MSENMNTERAGRFTKKSVTIDAWLIDFGNKPLPEWVNEAFRTEVIDWCPAGEGLFINTLEGPMLGANGSWLIKGVQGELYACKPDIFEATYTRASLSLPAAGQEPVAPGVRDDGRILLLPPRPAPDAPANTVGLPWDAYSGATMLAYGRACSDAALVAAAPKPIPSPAPAHVQNSPEIEHVADDVSKNGRESNMTAPAGESDESEVATLLRKYRKLCVAVGRGDSSHLARIDQAVVAATAPRPTAYCEPCQRVGMSNCSDFTHCGQPKCVTCHQPLGAARAAPQPAAQVAGQEPVAEVMFADGRKYIQYTMPLELIPVGTRFYAAPQPAVAAEWMPIETAPKDGSFLLLWEQYSETPFVGFWSDGSWPVSHEHVDAEGGGDSAIVIDVLSMPITHWMPLPPAPSTEGESK